MTNRNFTHNSNFTFQTNLFGEDSNYGIQSVQLPGLSFSHIEISRHSIMGGIQGDTINYNNLSLDLIIDEELKIWKDMVQKLQEMRSPDSGTSKQIEEFGYLEIHDDNTKKVLKLEFKGMMLESIGDMNYNTTSEDEVLTLNVTIKYDYFRVLTPD